MSFDPYASEPEEPSDPRYTEQPSRDLTSARQRVQGPAIGLIVIGVLNVFLTAGPAFYGFGVSNMSPAQLEEAMQQQNPKALEDMKKEGYTIEGIRGGFIIGSFSLAVVNFLLSFLVILGGIRMLALKNYGLAIVAAIVAAIPCFSCSGCCGLGAIIGIWAIVILINPEVRAAFQ